MFDTEKPTNDNESDPTNNAVNPTVDSSETNPESMDADIKSGKLGEDYQLNAASISEEELWDQIGLHKNTRGEFFPEFCVYDNNGSNWAFVNTFYLRRVNPLADSNRIL